MQDFKNLKVWEKAHALTLEICKSSKAFPRDEIDGLTNQVRRASASIGANIAEGACRLGMPSLHDSCRWLPVLRVKWSFT